MQLPSLRRIRTEDFPQSFQDLINKLAFPINSAFDSLYQALTNDLTFYDNFLCSQSSITITVDKNGNPTSNATILLNNTPLKGLNVTGLLLLNAVSSPTGTYPTGGIFISWSQVSTNSTQQLQINNITGLPANVQFTLTVVILS